MLKTDLTDREIEVANLLCEGKQSKEIAAKMIVGKRTVDFHLDNIYRKLGVKNRVQAVLRLIRE